MKRLSGDHFGLLRSTTEVLSALVNSADVETFLDRIVRMVGEHLHASVCSVYLYDEQCDVLVLRANVGLEPGLVGTLRLKPDEGLVGMAFRELRPICEGCASRSPAYRFVPDSGEDRYDAFLAVPVHHGCEKVGVLVVQRETGKSFVADEVEALRVLTAQLAGAIEKVGVLVQMAGREGRSVPRALPAGDGSGLIKGVGAAPGFCRGLSCLYRRRAELAMIEEGWGHGGSPHPRPVSVLETALERTAQQLAHLQEQVGKRLPEAATLIFDAHLLMLADRHFRGAMLERARRGEAPEEAVLRTARELMGRFESSGHEYIREKARDVEDLALRILGNLKGEVDGENPLRDRVVIGDMLYPSDMLRMAIEHAAGAVVTSGSVTSHVTILARSLQIPLVIAGDARLLDMADGTPVILDGDLGNVVLNPSEAVIRTYDARQEAARLADASAPEMREQTVTRDGGHVSLLANINLVGEVELALKMRAEGVGLYRTEFPFLIRDSLPSTEEQRGVYRYLFSRLKGKEITVRTLDAGGEKMLHYYDQEGDPNPELGLRSTRFLLAHPEVFDHQLRALLLAAADEGVTLRILFPMIGSPEEFRAAKARLLACREALQAETGAALAEPRIGMMIELPAIAETLDLFLDDVAFFSIGTNDFVQYMLGADRTNQRVAAYYTPHHPAVLRSLHRIADTLVRAGREVTVCGELAHNERFVPFLVGIGIRRLSVDPGRLPGVQGRIASFSLAEAEALAARALACRSVEAAAAVLGCETASVAGAD